jgi:hypothetical protein
MSAVSEPLKKERLIAITLSWAWFVIAACIGLNALIKYAHYRIRWAQSHIVRL